MSGLKKIRILTVILALTILFNPAVSRAEEEKDDGSSWMADEQDLSVANSLLFVREHLDGVNEATQFYYDFVRSGSLLSKVEDKVVVKIVKILQLNY